jgi:hypothetical protein
VSYLEEAERWSRCLPGRNRRGHRNAHRITAGGVIAHAQTWGCRAVFAALLGISFVCAFALMRDTGFTPNHEKRPIDELKSVVRGSIEHGIANPPVRSG